ncbi:MAG: FHA domain-containing protein [Bacteroidota bacterium]
MSGDPSQATLTIKSGPNAGRVVDLPQGELLIGRIEPAGLVIGDSEVSRRHARLTFREGRYFLEDLGSVNGTILGGQRISGECPLADGDEIQIGTKVVLVFHQPQPKPEIAREAETIMPGVESAAGLDATRFDQELKIPNPDATMFDVGGDLSALSSASAPPPPSLLVTVAGNEPVTHILSNDQITLGRAEDNDIVVPSMIVSRYHATLELTPSGYEIMVSPGATNTLTCQGRPVVGRQLLTHGSRN